MFYTSVLIRHLWQLKTVVFLQWYLKCALILPSDFLDCQRQKKRCIRSAPGQHVVDDAGHVRHQTVHSDFEQHHDGPANVLPDLRVVVVGENEQILDERVDVDHQRLRTANDELQSMLLKLFFLRY